MAVLTDNQIKKITTFINTYGYSHQECADMAGVSLSTFNRALRKDDKLREDNINKIISILGNHHKKVNVEDIENTFNEMDQKYTELLEETEVLEKQVADIQQVIDEKKEKLRMFEERNCKDLRESNHFEEVSLELEGA